MLIAHFMNILVDIEINFAKSLEWVLSSLLTYLDYVSFRGHCWYFDNSTVVISFDIWQCKVCCCYIKGIIRWSGKVFNTNRVVVLEKVNAYWTWNKSMTFFIDTTHSALGRFYKAKVQRNKASHLCSHWYVDLRQTTFLRWDQTVQWPKWFFVYHPLAEHWIISRHLQRAQLQTILLLYVDPERGKPGSSIS